MEPSSYMKCALKVDTQSPGWHKAMIKVLSSIQGVSYTLDVQQGKAYVSGNIDPGVLLKMLAKAVKHTELEWVDSRYQRKNPIVQGNVYHEDHGNTQYARLGYDYGNTQYGRLGYDDGNNQLERRGYYGDDSHESCEHNLHSEMRAHPSPHAPLPVPVLVAYKQREEKPVNCCMM